MKLLGIDVGGSGIKGAIVDTKTGQLTSERIRIPTPQPATPKAIAIVVGKICEAFKWKSAVGVSFPTIVKNGKAMHSGNLDSSIEGIKLDTLFESQTKQPFFVVNDADAAAMGVMTFGEGRNEKGLVMTITLGTGIGSGVFFNGELLSNFELGRLYGRKGDIMESFASDAARKHKEWDFKKWGKRLNFLLKHIEMSFNPDLIIIGGGVSKKFKQFSSYIHIKTPLRPAELKNNAGIVGAALFAKKQFSMED